MASLSHSCQFTNGDLRVVYGNGQIHFHSPLLLLPLIELIILTVCGPYLPLENLDSVCVSVLISVSV